MKSFKLKSQVATTIQQSELLLASGLKKETADMFYRTYGEGEQRLCVVWEGFGDDITKACNYNPSNDIPAWTLGRLLEMLDYNYSLFGGEDVFDAVVAKVSGDLACGWLDQDFCVNKKPRRGVVKLSPLRRKEK